jgi:hypothetical protein
MFSISIFRFFYFRPNNSVPSPDLHQSSPTQTTDSISSQVLDTKANLSSTSHSNDEFNSQQGKRKFSLSQYKEHKRLKSNDFTPNCSADIDMRINTTENPNVRLLSGRSTSITN